MTGVSSPPSLAQPAKVVNHRAAISAARQRHHALQQVRPGGVKAVRDDPISPNNSRPDMTLLPASTNRQACLTIPITAGRLHPRFFGQSNSGLRLGPRFLHLRRVLRVMKSHPNSASQPGPGASSGSTGAGLLELAKAQDPQARTRLVELYGRTPHEWERA